jgi:hypothetical protein
MANILRQAAGAYNNPTLVDCVAIVGHKGYCDDVGFLRFLPGLSSSWRSNTPRRILVHVVRMFGLKGGIARFPERTVCPEKMVTVPALIGNEELRSTTELAFANCREH